MSGEALLIVDDHPTNLKLVKLLLSGEGYQVYTAIDGAEVLRQLEKIHPKLILMDIELPDIDGLSLTKNLRANSKFNDIIIIAITAYGLKGDREVALAAGCNDYIAKPFDIMTLPSIISAHLCKK